jgi:hypothetical protein
MPLENPIIEVMKPSMKGAQFLDTPVPENIVPILELLGARAVPYIDGDNVPHWEITTRDGLHYIRVQQAYVEAVEDTWRELIGHLLDYAAAKSA